MHRRVRGTSSSNWGKGGGQIEGRQGRIWRSADYAEQSMLLAEKAKTKKKITGGGKDRPSDQEAREKRNAAVEVGLMKK